MGHLIYEALSRLKYTFWTEECPHNMLTVSFLASESGLSSSCKLIHHTDKGSRPCEKNRHTFAPLKMACVHQDHSHFGLE